MIGCPIAHLFIQKNYCEFLMNSEFSGIGIQPQHISLCQSLNYEDNLLFRQPPWMSLIIEILVDSEEDLTLTRLSGMVGVHPVHISRTFPKYAGCPLGEFRRLIKLKK